MTKLIQRMREELVRRNYAETTIRSYLQTLESSGALLTSVWTISVRTRFGSTKFISWRNESWEWAL